ncbi:hypothetical protein [Flavobacterium sp.]|uniref:hypothetical protein n=1 Tax=Flavobacterium sp. TaxID=239 RepID=UPI0024897C3B|nr:hypothetical protein [Flavobacterium sp.]MDI1316901.1 hypothetical protein [Flavobacterium sp.]
MISKVDQLISAFDKVVREPWNNTLSGQEKVWFLVYDPSEQRKIDLRIGDFENTTIKSGKKWVEISLKSCFPTWMAAHDYKEEYFQDPEALVDQLDVDFKEYAIRFLLDKINNSKCDENTLIAIKEASSLFGFTRMSDVINGCSSAIEGRMLIFFPGEFEKNQYRLLDARDGWDYLARPITL